MISRREAGKAAGVAWLGGAGDRRLDQRLKATSRAGVGPAPSNVFVGTRVIVFGPHGGVFVYSPTPGAGNLVASIAPQNGTDSFGNAYLAGEASYQASTGKAISNDGGQITFWTGPAGGAGPWVNQALMDFSPTLAATEILTNSLMVGASAGASQRTATVAPSGDATGVTDRTAIASLLSFGTSVQLTPGTFFTDQTLTLAGSNDIRGSAGTILQPAAALPGGMIKISGTDNYAGGYRFKPNGFSADAIQVAPGANRWTVRDIIAESVLGLVVNITGSTGANHGVISGVLATGCNGGIDAEFGSGSSTLELSIAQCNIQSCQSAPVLKINGVTDVAVSDLNGSVATGSGVPAVQVIGNAQAIFMTGVDVGGDSTAGGTTAVLDIGSSGAPSEIAISDSVFQSGGNGIVVGAGSRVRFSSVMAKRNQFDGWQWNGTGTFNQMFMCAGNLNNQAAGVAYDTNITSTAHVIIDAFAYVSGAVTAGRNITLAGNHVTAVNDPAGTTTAGNAPAGW